jgi:hypothetical protein
MSQLNIQMSAAFEQKLKRYMRARGLKTKADAVRTAIEEGLQSSRRSGKISIRELYGSAKGLPLRPRREWLTEDDLWEKNGR